MSDSDEKLLLETCRICAGAILNIQIVLNKVEDEDLSDDLNRQLGHYIRFINKANNELRKNNRKLFEKNPIDRMKAWSKIQKKTLLNNSTKHIADLMIKDNTNKIAYMLKAIHDYSQSECCEFAKELVEFEEQSVLQLRYYLD